MNGALPTENSATAVNGRTSFHALDSDGVLAVLGVEPQSGLTEAEAAARLQQFGPNIIISAPARSRLAILADQFVNPVVWLLAGAMALSIGLRDWPEAIAIAAVLFINTAIGFVAELNAVRSMEALRQLDVRTASIRREGLLRAVDASVLVPGDIVVLEAGDHVPADLRITTAPGARTDESALTGESAPVDKSQEKVSETARLHERSSMLFKGTNLVAGTAEGVVVASGSATELGEIAQLVQTAAPSRSPLEKRLAVLARDLIWLTMIAVLGLGVLGLWSGQPVVQMIQATIALAVAAIPEGLPIVATLALGRGMLRMARQNALVRSLGAVETLGATSVILTDKTGTLTENQMRVDGLIALDRDGQTFRFDPKCGKPPTPTILEALRIGVLCSSAEPAPDGFSGDPVEVALLEVAQALGIEADVQRKSSPRVQTKPFDSESRMMATTHSHRGQKWTAVKGAPEALLGMATHILMDDQPVPLKGRQREAIEAACEERAQHGQRLIALARKDGGWDNTDPADGFCLLAVAAMHDPARDDVKGAIADCHNAGLRIVMVTGDHPATAQAIADAVGFDAARFGDRVFARVAPSEKLGIVAEFQAGGAIAAMTGDGVNDAPALNKADIGIAMGIRGTDVAKEAADIVLLDDAFRTIVSAIREGRVIFENIRRVCVYLLSCNVGEILLIAMALSAGMPLPLLPLQILFLNLLTDVFPAFAVALGEAEGDVGQRSPRPADEPVLRRAEWLRIGLYGAWLAAASFLAFWWSINRNGAGPEAAATVAFLTIGFGQLLHVFAMRDPGSAVLNNAITQNRWVWGAMVLCAAAMLLAVYLPLLAHAFSFVPPTNEDWAVIGICAILPFFLGQIERLIRR